LQEQISMASQKLLKVLVPPSKIASSLDWKKVSGSVLSLDIHQDHIGLALASHPSFGEKAHTLKPIQLPKKGRRVTEECRALLAEIVAKHKVCGLVVSWPLQPDTGKMGAACGRVLHTLEDIVSTNNEGVSNDLDSSSILTRNRPLCLWDGVHPTPETEDEWGRCAAYARTSDKAVHRASEEQYHQDKNIVAAKVWEDFCRVHWPTIHEQQQRTKDTVDWVLQQEERSSSLEDDVLWEDSPVHHPNFVY